MNYISPYTSMLFISIKSLVFILPLFFLVGYIGKKTFRNLKWLQFNMISLGIIIGVFVFRDNNSFMPLYTIVDAEYPLLNMVSLVTMAVFFLAGSIIWIISKYYSLSPKFVWTVSGFGMITLSIFQMLTFHALTNQKIYDWGPLVLTIIFGILGMVSFFMAYKRVPLDYVQKMTNQQK